MSDPAGTYFDAPNGFLYYRVPRQQGMTVPKVDNVRKSMIYEQRFWQLGDLFERKPWSSPGPRGSYLVEETEPTDLGFGGLVEWIRRFAAKPPTRTEYGNVAHPYQYLVDGSSLVDVAKSVRMTTTFTYYHITGDPAGQITLAEAFRYVKIGNFIKLIGTPPGPGDTTVLHEDEAYSRWLGNIYEKVSKSVPKPNLVAVA